MANKKTVSLFMAAIMAVAALFTFSACTPKAPELTGIEITKAPTKVEYVLGEKFDPAGMTVSKIYDDETKTALTDEEYTWDLKGELKLTDKKVTVSYKTEDKTYNASVNIKVTNDIKSVEIITEPEKMEYIVGEVFVPDGMTIQATLENGEKEEIVEVSADTVTYKTTGLAKSDSHFEMNYGGCTFYLDMSVAYGAFVEAEKGLIIKSGVKIAAGPAVDAIESDLVNAPSRNGDGIFDCRGIDKGLPVPAEVTGTYSNTIQDPRVDVRTYVAEHPEWVNTTGGGRNGSGSTKDNLIEFERGKGGQILYSLTGDKSGRANVILKMANPNFDGSGDTGYTAPETQLNTVLKITVNGTPVNIPDTVKLAAVDWTQYKSYVPGKNVGEGTYTGKACKPIYFWQNVAVEIPMVAGGNSIIVESIHETKEVYIDSISYNADKDEINLTQEGKFNPEVVFARLKVEGEGEAAKVLMGLIVDPKSIGYDDSAIQTVLGLTKVATERNATWQRGDEGNLLKPDDNDPWTQSLDNGGLGYTTAPLGLVNGMGYKDNMGGKGASDSVEKITEGEYAGLYCVWFDVTINPDNPDKAPTPDKNRYQGVWCFSSFNYGAAYAQSSPSKDILKTDENVTAELGSFCYQVYCDSRDDNITFGWGNLCLVVQYGTFDEEKAAASSLPLRSKLMRRYVSHWGNDMNDQELVDKHN